YRGADQAAGVRRRGADDRAISGDDAQSGRAAGTGETTARARRDCLRRRIRGAEIDGDGFGVATGAVGSAARVEETPRRRHWPAGTPRRKLIWPEYEECRKSGSVGFQCGCFYCLVLALHSPLMRITSWGRAIC